MTSDGTSDGTSHRTSRFGARPLIAAVAAAGRIDHLFGRSSNAALRFVQDVGLHALDEHELLRVRVALHTTRPHHDEVLLPWEERWLDARLPKPPARILVGACGAGRELAWLAARRYDVAGFDPTPALVEVARRRVPRARIDTLTFVDFAADPGRFDATFGAVVIGSGSLSFALSERARVDVLQACARACPRGPILVSWQAAPVDAQRATEPGRAAAGGRRVGRVVGALRGVTRDARGDVFRADTGVLHELNDLELLRSAESAGLIVKREPGADPPHATLRRRAGKRREDVEMDLLVDVLSRGHRPTVVARGGSMTPAIAHGSRVVLAPIDHASQPAFELGDVVAATVKGVKLIHRIVGIDARGALLLKGDALSGCDGWVTADAVIARAVDVPAARHPLTRLERARRRLQRAWHALR